MPSQPAEEKALYLLNQFDASSPLHLDVRAILQQQLGDRLLPFVLRRSSAGERGTGRGNDGDRLCAGFGGAEDYRGLAGWLRSFAPPAIAGNGGTLERAMNASCNYRAQQSVEQEV